MLTLVFSSSSVSTYFSSFYVPERIYVSSCSKQHSLTIKLLTLWLPKYLNLCLLSPCHKFQMSFCWLRRIHDFYSIFLPPESPGNCCIFISKHQVMRSSPLPQKFPSEKHNLVFEDLCYYIHYCDAAKRYLVANHGPSLVFLKLKSCPWAYTHTISCK